VPFSTPTSEVNRRRGFEVVGLLTTFNQEADRVAMHAVRRELVYVKQNEWAFPSGQFSYRWAMSQRAI
jgi:hypothetical protein